MEKVEAKPNVNTSYTALLTEFRDQYSNPQSKRLKGFEEFEKNRRGRMAYKPEKDNKAAEGILPLYNGIRYPKVIPKYTLPKLDD